MEYVRSSMSFQITNRADPVTHDLYFVRWRCVIPVPLQVQPVVRLSGINAIDVRRGLGKRLVVRSLCGKDETNPRLSPYGDDSTRNQTVSWDIVRLLGAHPGEVERPVNDQGEPDEQDEEVEAGEDGGGVEHVTRGVVDAAGYTVDDLVNVARLACCADDDGEGRSAIDTIQQAGKKG